MSRALVFLLITFWFCLVPFLVKGQPYYFKHYETDDGLINNSVNAITQDKDGFIWVGTRGGLARFDGYLFKSINNHINQRGNLWNNFITCIAQDSKGVIWIGTGRGMFSYNPSTEILTPLTASPQVYINGFVLDDRDNLWLLGQNRLYLYEQNKKQIQDLKIHVSRIALNLDGNLLLGNYDGILFKCDTRTKIITQTRVIDPSVAPNLRAITKIYSINEKLAFIGYKKGLMIYNLQTGETRSIPLKSETDIGVLVRDICRSKGQEYWIATENGLYIYDLKKASLLRLTKKQGDPYAISDNSIYALFRDKRGDMWVGTYFGGLNHYSKQNARFEKFYPIPLKNSLSGNAVSEVWNDRRRYLYVGTEDAGLNRLDTKTNQIINYTAHPKPDGGFYSNIHSLAGFGNHLFIGSYFHGLQIMDRTKGKITDIFKVINEPGEYGSDFVLSMYSTRDTSLLVGTTGDYGGLYRYISRKKVFNRFKQIPLGSTVYHILEDHRGWIWTGLKSQTALYIDPKTGRYGKIVFGDPANESSVHYMLEDRSHALWFSTVGAGLMRLAPDRKTFKKFTVKQGLPSDVLFGMLEDDDNQLWVGSSNGLVCLDLKTEKIKVYTQANGLITNQFNFNSACKSSTGKLFFGTVKGLIGFDPRALHQNEPAPGIFFTSLQINNAEVSPADAHSPLTRSVTHIDTLILGPNQRNFSIEFAALNFSSAKATRYQYRMRGLDRSWTYSNTNRKAYFTDLSPGRYTFTVKAASNVGTWVSKERSLYIEVLPPFWRSNLAYFLYILLFCLSIYILFQQYHGYQRKKSVNELKLFEHQKQKEIYQAKIEFFTHIAHEIQTPLTLISVPVTRVLKQVDDFPTLKKSLLMINKYTNRLVDLTSQLLDFRQTEKEEFGLNFVNVGINQLLFDLVDAYQDLALADNIGLSLELPEQTIDAFVDREAFIKILSNLLSNALKYGSSDVKVSLILSSPDQFSIQIANDGKAIPDEYHEKIFQPFFRLKNLEKPGTGIGLSLARSLTELHKGSLILSCGKTDKIVFVLTLPMHQQYEFNLSTWKNINPHE